MVCISYLKQLPCDLLEKGNPSKRLCTQLKLEHMPYF